MRRKGILLLAILAAVTVLGLSGCGGGGSSTAAPPASTPSGSVEGKAK